jgi:cell division protein FtsW (lipid II flippase)
VKKTIFMTLTALGVTALILVAQDASKFNGTWKGDKGNQVRRLTYKGGVVYMEETQPNGNLILRQYPTQGQEVTMTEGVWKDSKATGKMEGNKLVVDTTMPNGTKWHDEWTLAEDGKSYSALRQLVAAGEGGAFGKGGGKGPGGGGGGKGKGGGGGGPETFTKVE